MNPLGLDSNKRNFQKKKNTDKSPLPLFSFVFFFQSKKTFCLVLHRIWGNPYLNELNEVNKIYGTKEKINRSIYLQSNYICSMYCCQYKS